MSQLDVSAREYHRILKLARPIADLAGCEDSQSVYVADALDAPQLLEVDDRLIQANGMIFSIP